MSSSGATHEGTAAAGADLAVGLSQFAAGIDVRHLDAAVIKAVEGNILDTLACALAGSSAKGIPEVSGLVQEWGGAPQADVFVLGGKYPAHHAAWVNSAMAHARDYDDTHDAAILHAGITTVPAAIAAGQLKGKLSGADLIAAVAAGLELTCRLGVGIKVNIIETGFIYTSLLGYFGATAAAGRALGLTAEQMLNAFGIVYSSVAGNHQVTRDASLMKRLQPGLGAQAAVVAAQLAQRGIRGVQNVFDGPDGFFRVYFQNRVDRETVCADLGQRFELLNLSYKPYPCCRDVHTAVDAILALRTSTATPRPASDVRRIRVGTTAAGYQMVCVPEHVRLAPKTIVEAQFSIPYTVAAAWIDGELVMKHFSDDGLARADVLDLASRVQPYVDDEIEREWSRYVPPARVTVEFRDGQAAEMRVNNPKGHPRNPMTEAEFAAKTEDCARFVARRLGSDTARSLIAEVGQLRRRDDIAGLVRVMTGA